MDRSNNILGDASTGTLLMKCMERKGMSKERLAKETGLSINTIYRICGGDRIGTIDTWLRISCVLQCGLGEILELDGERE